MMCTPSYYRGSRVVVLHFELHKRRSTSAGDYIATATHSVTRRVGWARGEKRRQRSSRYVTRRAARHGSGTRNP